ncbi:ATP-binding protein [Polyangium sp. 6x1]|uniref:ATP-binding protein n=1 Tax=Polyangium sp. 6x1 TaxID=3042689 RepID=UPI00248320A2|nr:ATP-binding protein [Polyangium sp. 6x1]MDI1444662.1 ATP-binding protein [Polyangium sp. 6x1]
MSAGGNRTQTAVGASISIAPLDHVAGDVAGLLGNFLFDLLGMFYPRQICSKANVVVIELVTNVMEHCSIRDGALRVDLKIDGDELMITVANPATEDEFKAVSDRFTVIANAEDPRKLLADTVYRRRIDKAKGGLGLMRLTAESKFKLTAEYEQGFLVVKALFPMRGFA